MNDRQRAYLDDCKFVAKFISICTVAGVLLCASAVVLTAYPIATLSIIVLSMLAWVVGRYIYLRGVLEE